MQVLSQQLLIKVIHVQIFSQAYTQGVQPGFTDKGIYYIDKGILLATKTLVESIMSLHPMVYFPYVTSGISINSRLFYCCCSQNGRRVQGSNSTAIGIFLSPHQCSSLARTCEPTTNPENLRLGPFFGTELYIKDITQLREDMDFVFEWQE